MTVLQPDVESRIVGWSGMLRRMLLVVGQLHE